MIGFADGCWLVARPNGSSAQQRKVREDPTVAVAVQFDIEVAEHLGTGRLHGSFVA